MAESVKVAVRVRPFNKRELEMPGGNKLCIEMNGKQTTIRNMDPKPADIPSYNVDGYCTPLNSRYADQQRVFDDLGVAVLDNAFDGYNTCLFAYGQTGSGKSYSMIGYGQNKGIVPMVCDEIFKRIQNDKNPDVRYEVSVSMLEIYNECVQDLLVPPKLRADVKSLKIGEDADRGTYVMGLTSYLVNSYAEINEKLEEGSRNRTVGETKMNQTSSRAHTVFRIAFKQIERIGGEETYKTSDINLIDLAGSERAGSTGATGSRLKEGANINQSLSTLGKVISALADKSSGKLPKNAVIPYRESKLTRILQGALGGNSKTTMIAALSPSYANFDETLSTLRYADRVKQIKNDAKQNTDPASEELRRLQEENARLLALLEGRGGLTAGPGVDLDDIRLEYDRKLKAMEDMQLSYEERLKKSRALAAQNRDLQEEESAIPELRNISDDPQLTGRVRYVLHQGKKVLGRATKGQAVQPDIPVVASGMLPEHALIHTEKVSEDGDEDEYESTVTAVGKLFVNGELLTVGSSQRLYHKDVISFGSMKFFVFWEPQNVDKVYPDWEEVTSLNSEGMAAQLGGVDEEAIKEEVARKVRAEQEKLEKEKDLMEQQRLEFERELQERERALHTKDREEAQRMREEIRKEKERQTRELEAQQKALEQKQRQLQTLQNEEQKRIEEEMRAKRVLESTIAKALLIVDEANNMADDLNQPVLFSVKLVHKPVENGKVSSGLTFQRTQIQVKVDRFEEDLVHFWPLDLFDDKLYLIKDLWNDWLAHDDPSTFVMPQRGSPEDPFASDPDSQIVIGQAQLYLDAIRALISIEREVIPIFDYKGAKSGEVAVGLLIELDDTNDQEELDLLDSIEDLIGRPVRLTLMIDQGFDIPLRCSRNVSLSARWIDQLQDVVCVSADDAPDGTTNPKFNFYKEFVLPVTQETLAFFQNDLYFEVTGMAPLTGLHAHGSAGSVTSGQAGNPFNSTMTSNLNGTLPRGAQKRLGSANAVEQKLQEKEKEAQELQKKLADKEKLLKQLEEKARAQGKPLYDKNGDINQELCAQM